jgi:polyisoprenoid-binding protein YceI
MKTIIGIFVGAVVGIGIIFFLSQEKNGDVEDLSTPEQTSISSTQDPVEEFSQVTSGEYIIDPSKSKIEWIGRAMGKNHNGYVNVKNGSIIFDEDVPIGGQVVADMVNIVNEDLAGEEQSKLIAHLKSDDFFAVADHPEAILIIKSMEPVDGEDRYGIVADLTIKGVTKEVVFDADVEDQNGTVLFTSQFNIDRTEWGVTFGSDSLVDQIQEGVTDDVITFNMLLVGILEGSM